MKILMVAIPNHHFFQWVNQLEQAGHEVHWFDITDGAGFSNKIKWVKQCNGWKLRWDFPFRSTLKNKLPKLYSFIQLFNERKLEPVFQNYLHKIKPDIVHVFDLELTGIPLLSAFKNNKSYSLIYSSWGSDMFYFRERGISPLLVNTFLNKVNVIVSDCHRDIKLAKKNGLKDNSQSFVLPGNGGISLLKDLILPTNQRNIILLKGYQFDVGEAIQIIKAIELLPVSLIKNYEIIVYSSDNEIIEYVQNSEYYMHISIKLFARNIHVPNSDILEIMGKSVLHIANNVSDGMPNSLLEAMGMGAFPIQSNPGNVTEEVITHGKNGFLIFDSFDIEVISKLILNALQNEILRQTAQEYNTRFILDNYDRKQLKNKIVAVYNSVKNN